MSGNVLHLDPLFRGHAAALGMLVPKDQVLPLDAMFENMRRFTDVRRHEARLAILEASDRAIHVEWRSKRKHFPDAVKGFSDALKLLSEHAKVLQPLIVPALDDVIALAADDGHPLHMRLSESALSLGYSRNEADWFFNELGAIEYRPVNLVCANGFEDFVALLSSISLGEAGLLLAGFARFTGDPGNDERLEKLIIRLREKDVTPSIFLALTIVITAHAVATLE
jgi:hypothetical protein